jgi:light-harvesting complex I chlorophyll a/b binding protein 1
MALDKKTLPGVSAPFGYWDPAGLLKDADDNKINYFRELEIKNGRVAMLAALGYAVAEKYHPFYTGEEKGAISGLASFGGDGYDARFDVGFTRALTAVDQLNAKYVIAITLILAVFETGAFYGRFFGGDYEEDRQPGDIGFDPLNLKPKDPQQLKRIQTQEINNGRLAMLAITGMIGQEFNTDYQPLDINIFAPN